MASSEPVPPAGYGVRAATPEDLPSIDELFIASEVALGVRAEPRSGYLRWRWSQPYVDVERDTRIVTRDGAAVAFAMAFAEGTSPGLTRCLGRVHPDHAGRGLGGWLLGFFERHGRAVDGVMTCRVGIPDEDAAGHDLVAAAGYRRVRTSFDMGVALDGGFTAGPPPEGIAIRSFLPGEERLVWRLEIEAFRDHWDHVHDQPFEAFLGDWFEDPAARPSILIAEMEGRPVGEVAWIVDHGVPYVFSVAVIRDARGRGVATALLRHAMAAAAADGYGEMTLSVDAASPTGAVRVYEKVGMSVLRSLAIYDKDVM